MSCVLRFLCVSVLLGGLAPAASQEPISGAGLLEQLRAQDWVDRGEALRMLQSRGLLEERVIADEIVSLLRRENELVARSPIEGVDRSTALGEGYSLYYSGVLRAARDAANLASTEDLEVLAWSIYNPDSPYAIDLADSGGSRIIPIAFALLQAESEPKRWNGVALLVRLYEQRSVHMLPEDIAVDILNTVRMLAADDPSRSIRRQAVESLGRIGTAIDIELLRDIAEFDEALRDTERGPVYPVRDEAIQAIERILLREPVE